MSTTENLKDIFIDTNIAKNFKNPADPEYKKLLAWLFKEGVWVVNQKLLVEYGRTNQNILVLTNILLREGRLIKVERSELDEIKFKKAFIKSLESNNEDWTHLKTIWLSVRKIGIIIDNGLRNDVNNSPLQNGIQPRAVSRPQDIDYENS
jgi:hypothetical protein